MMTDRIERIRELHSRHVALSSRRHDTRPISWEAFRTVECPECGIEWTCCGGSTTHYRTCEPCRDRLHGHKTQSVQEEREAFRARLMGLMTRHWQTTTAIADQVEANLHGARKQRILDTLRRMCLEGLIVGRDAQRHGRGRYMRWYRLP